MPEEIHPNGTTEPGEHRPWQFSLRGLLVLTTLVACACSLFAWLGPPVVVAMLGASAGAWLGAMACPWIGFDDVLDDVRSDVLKCLAVGGYFVGGAWGMVAGLKWLLRQVFAEDTPVFISTGLILFFLLTVWFVVRMLWPDSDPPEAVVITLARTFSFLGRVF